MNYLNYLLPPLTILKKLGSVNPLLPFYHMVSNEQLPHIRYQYKKINEFKADLDFLLKYYTPVSLLDLLKSQQSLPKNACLLTFDDGFSQMADIVAPILKAKGLSATFFLVSSFLDNQALGNRNKGALLIHAFKKLTHPASFEMAVNTIFTKNELTYTYFEHSIIEGVKYSKKHVLDEVARLLEVDFNEYLAKNKPYLTSSQVNQLIKDGFTIGAHSVDHPLYLALSLEQQLAQTKTSLTFLKEKFSLNYRAFAFPFSDVGVSKKFFETVFQGGEVEISFGTAGSKQDSYCHHLQRIPMEQSRGGKMVPASNLIKVEYTKKILRSLVGQNQIIRI